MEWSMLFYALNLTSCVSFSHGKKHSFLIIFCSSNSCCLIRVKDGFIFIVVVIMPEQHNVIGFPFLTVNSLCLYLDSTTLPQIRPSCMLPVCVFAAPAPSLITFTGFKHVSCISFTKWTFRTRTGEPFSTDMSSHMSCPWRMKLLEHVNLLIEESLDLPDWKSNTKLGIHTQRLFATFLAPATGETDVDMGSMYLSVGFEKDRVAGGVWTHKPFSSRRNISRSRLGHHICKQQLCFYPEVCYFCALWRPLGEKQQKQWPKISWR